MSKFKFKDTEYYVLKKSFGKFVWVRNPKTYLTKGENKMTSRVFFAGVASLGLFANLFVAFAGKNLESNMASLFTNIGSIAIASALVYLILSSKCQAEIDAERSEVHRDFDAVYRYIDDTARDVRDAVKECSRNNTCSKK